MTLDKLDFQYVCSLHVFKERYSKLAKKEIAQFFDIQVNVKNVRGDMCEKNGCHVF